MTFNHTHCQAAQSWRRSQSLTLSVAEPTLGQKIKSTIAHRCISVMLDEQLKFSIFDPNTYCGGRTVNRSETMHYAYNLPFGLMRKLGRPGADWQTCIVEGLRTGTFEQ